MKLSYLRNADVIAVLAISIAFSVPVHGEEDASKPSRPLILDMVHHNLGEPLYESAYEDPVVIKEMSYNGKVNYLFDSPPLAIDWESVDPEIFPKRSKGRCQGRPGQGLPRAVRDRLIQQPAGHLPQRRYGHDHAVATPGPDI